MFLIDRTIAFLIVLIAHNIKKHFEKFKKIPFSIFILSQASFFQPLIPNHLNFLKLYSPLSLLQICSDGTCFN